MSGVCASAPIRRVRNVCGRHPTALKNGQLPRGFCAAEIPRVCVTREARGSFSARRLDSTRMNIQNLTNVSLEEAQAYLALAEDDEVEAAILLAMDRNLLAGYEEEPDEQEIHHALFLLRKARGLEAPSFDALRIALKKRTAA